MLLVESELIHNRGQLQSSVYLRGETEPYFVSPIFSVVEKIRLVSSIQYFSISDPSKLLAFFEKSKNRLYSLQIEFLHQQPSSKYTNFLSNTTRGQQRLKTYIDCFEESLRGNLEIFVADQTKMGYKRATEGYTLLDISHFILSFRSALKKAIIEYNREVNASSKLDIEDVFYIHDLVVDYSWLQTSLSYIKARDEIIDRNRKRIESLQSCTANLISASSEKMIYEIVRTSIYDIYKLSSTFCAVKEGNYSQGKSNETQIPEDILKKITSKLQESEHHVAIDKHKRVFYLHTSRVQKSFLYIGTPIFNRQGALLGILVIHKQGSLFTFLKFDLNLLNQFAYVMGVMLGNIQMSTEIEEQRSELHYLAGRLISIQEKERRKTAADIHDTVAQALSAIGYKALYCQKIAEKNPQRLDAELTALQENINIALHQCRQIIGDLRPPSLYDLGIVSALRKLVNEFKENENTKVKFTFPKEIKVHSSKGIVLFRILQEALRNISQHAKASMVDVRLESDENASIHLKVSDNGQGFSPHKKKSSGKMGLGLIIMRERAEDVGGVFDVKSSPGHGCTLEVAIPI